MLARPHDNVLDLGPRKIARGTQRFCAATGAVKPIDEMIRFVIGADGIWITATRDALRAAIARKAFARGFKRDVRLAAELVETTERMIERAALDALAICHKAGKVATGFARVEAALARGPVVGLLNAAGAGSDGTRKLAAALHRRADGVEIIVVDTFTSAQLDLALGRPNVVHAALLAGPESKTFLARTARLARFRAGSPSEGRRDSKSADVQSRK